jgi:hypothetical protein
MITPFETMINDIKKHYKLSNNSLAYELGVSSYAIHTWLNGQRPSKPNYIKVKELHNTIKKEIVADPVEFDVFDDMQKVFYSKRLKAVFGMKISSVLTTFNQWCRTNEKHGEHFYNGHYWCATTFDIAYDYWFKYSFTSKQDFSDAVNKLRDAKLLIESSVLTDKGNTRIWRVDVERLTKLYQERVKTNEDR